MVTKNSSTERTLAPTAQLATVYRFIIYIFPNAQSIAYLPTWYHKFRPNVGKYFIHWASGTCRVRTMFYIIHPNKHVYIAVFYKFLPLDFPRSWKGLDLCKGLTGSSSTHSRKMCLNGCSISLGMLDHLLRMVMGPKYSAFWRWL